MMHQNRIFMLCLLVLPMLVLGGRTQAQSNFQKALTYGADEGYLLEGALLDSAQTVVGLGYVTDSFNRTLLMATDVQGNVLWAKSPSKDVDASYGLDHMAVEGNAIYLIGHGDSADVTGVVTKMDASGHVLWSQGITYTQEYSSLEVVAGDGQGNVVTGSSLHDITFSERAIVSKFRGSDGALLWSSTIDDSIRLQVQALAATPAGDVVAAGFISHFPSTDNQETWLAKWSATGTLQWAKKMDFLNYFGGLAVTADGIYLGGHTAPEPFSWDTKMYVAKFNYAGQVAHWKTYASTAHETRVEDMKAIGNDVLVMCYSSDASTGYEYPVLMHMDSALSVVWACEFQYSNPVAIAGKDASGNVHFMGGYFGPPLNAEALSIGAMADGPANNASCGILPFTPSFATTSPTVIDYPVTTGTYSGTSLIHQSYLDLPLSPVTQCLTVGTADPVAPENGMRIFPNPATDRIHVQWPSTGKQAVLHIMDASGKVVHAQAGKSEMDVDVQALPAGLYLVRVAAGERTWVERVSILR